MTNLVNKTVTATERHNRMKSFCSSFQGVATYREKVIVLIKIPVYVDKRLPSSNLEIIIDRNT